MSTMDRIQMKGNRNGLNLIINLLEFNSFEELIYRYQSYSRVEMWFAREETTKEFQLKEKVKHYFPNNNWFVLNVNYDEVFYPLVQSITDNTSTFEQAIPMFNKQGFFKDHCVISMDMMTSEINKKSRNYDTSQILITHDLFEYLLKEVK